MSAASATLGADLPELCRVCILPDARAKAIFSDNTIVVTNSSGSSFLLIASDGRITRQLSEYALTRHSPLLAALLEFRNMHVDLPCFCKPLARALRSSFALGYLVRDATWPSPSHAVESGLAQVQPDGKVVVSSVDGVAQVVLHGHFRRFAVCYPLLVAERPQEAKYEYVWQTQVFSVASHPARWQPAVRTALQAAAQLGLGVHAVLATLDQPQQLAHSQVAQEDAGHLGQICSGGSEEGASGAGGGGGCGSDRRSVLPRADDNSARPGLTEPLHSGGWWCEPSLSLLPPEDELLLEWTPHATYHYLSEAGEVEVWVHADESCLVSRRGGRFMAHYKDSESEGQLYAANCVPEAVWSRDQAYRYPLGLLAAHALKLRSHNTTVAAAVAARLPAHLGDNRHLLPGTASRAPGSSGTPDELFAAASTAVLEESCVAGHGQFTAYQDGRVRVCFEDRTILHMSASHSHAKVVLPDGRGVVVAVANPVGVEPYVAAAVDFASWAFKTPAERSEEMRLQARV
ncbi:hypothetical protein Agub_g1085, partial [Astrephomene gubernaculifera]